MRIDRERIAQAAYATTRTTVSDVPHRDRKAKDLCQLAIIEPSQVIDCIKRRQGEHLDHSLAVGRIRRPPLEVDIGGSVEPVRDRMR